MIVICLTIWQRHDLTKIVLDRWRELKSKYDIEIVVAGSEGDVSRNLCDGLVYVETENYPLTAKSNAMIQKAKELNPDGIVVMGSDDIMCENLLQYYFTLLDKDCVVGFKDIYFYSTHTKEIVYWQYKNGKTIGAGRFYSKKVLDKCEWKLWHRIEQRGMDRNNSEYMTIKEIKEEFIYMNDMILIDIKHEDNITSHSIMETGKTVDISILEKLGSVANEIKALQPCPSKKVISIHNEKRQIDAAYIASIDWSKVPEKVVIVGNVFGHRLMPRGSEFDVTKDTAIILVNKGFAKLKEHGNS